MPSAHPRKFHDDVVAVARPGGEAKIEGQDAFQLPMSGGPPSDRDTYWMVSIAS